mgnify:CR=1 FL=1
MSEAQSVAAIQMVSGFEVEPNLVKARELLEEAASRGVSVAVLPENFAAFQSRHLPEIGRAEAGGAEGSIQAFLEHEAKRLGLWIVAGSIPMASRPDGSVVDGGRVRASCVVVNAQGHQVARYDKIHLFDAQVGDSHGRYRESAVFEPGDTVVCVDTPVGRLGLSICYDLRFPELYRRLREEGAEWVVVPSAFTYRTGEAHWEALLRARAIENQVWICAPNQGGQHDERRRTWGHSMVVDPWGGIVTELPEGPGVVDAQLDPQMLANTRSAIPVWDHRRL